MNSSKVIRHLAYGIHIGNYDCESCPAFGSIGCEFAEIDWGNDTVHEEHCVSSLIKWALQKEEDDVV